MRGRHVLIACIDGKGGFILGSKPKYYPEGIYRMVGGGVEGSETPKECAFREAKEELGIIVEGQELEEVAEVEVFATDEENQKYHLITYIYFLDIGDKSVSPGDDIEKIVTLNEKEFLELINRYLNFPKNLFFRDDSGASFYWEDYGRVYGPVHQIAYNFVKGL